MANDNRRDQEGRNQNDKQNPDDDTFPANPNRQKQNSPGQQQGGDHGLKKDHPHLHEDRSVTDRTTRRSVIDRDDEDDDIDALKG